MSSHNSLHNVFDAGFWNLEFIQTVLERDSSSINDVNLFEDTPLTRVLENENCSIGVVDLLLNYGSDINYSNSNHWKTPLVIAIRTSRNVEFINLLLERGANVNVPGPGMVSIICLAFQYSSIDVVRLLLDAGCLQFECASHGTILHCAVGHIAIHPRDECVLLLFIEKKANINADNKYGQSVLCYALSIGLQASSIKVLLAAGMAFNCTVHRNLLICATIGTTIKLDADLVRVLVEHGACVDMNVLKCAVQKRLNDHQPIELLLSYIQNVHIKMIQDEINNTLLHLAVENPIVERSLVKFLVKQGIGVNMVNENGDTALHKLATHPYAVSDVIKILLKKGSLVNLENSSGKTPLHLAMINEQRTYTFKILMVAGARIGAIGYSLLIDCIAKCNSSASFVENLMYEHKRRLDCCKMLVKCYFLEYPNFDFQNMIQGHCEYEELSRFGVDCVHEVLKLDSQVFSPGVSLRDFLNQRSPFQVGAAIFEIEAENFFFHLLMRIIAQNSFPLFLDIIAAKFGMSSMKIKLQKLQVYTYLCDESRMGQKVFLNYDVVRKIAFLLPDGDDLLNFIFAFYKPNDFSCVGNINKEKSQQHCKRLRLYN